MFEERVKDIVDRGESVRFRKPNPAAPKSPEMKGIQSALDEMCRSEKYVRDQRRGKYPHYPYASEEQKTLAETRPHTYTVLHTFTPTHTHTRARAHAQHMQAGQTRRPARWPIALIRTHACTHARMHARTHAHTHTRTPKYAHPHLGSESRTQLNTHTHTPTHPHTHTHTHTRTHTHEHTPTLRFTRVSTEVRSGELILVALNCVELKCTRNCIPSLSLPVNFQVEFERAGGTASGLVPVAHGAPFQLEGQLSARSGTVPRLPTCVVSQCTLRPGPGRRLMLRRQCAH